MSLDQATELQADPEQVAAQARRRRFVGLAVPRPRALRRAQVITEGTSTHDMLVREGLYRRALATSDAVAAGLVLWLVVGVRAGGGLDLWTFIAMPLIVVVNKIAGLYERDEIVLKKTTLDEAPALIQITGLFSLLVWLGHTDFFGAAPTPNQVLMLWVGTFGALLLGRAGARALVARIARPERCFLIGDQAALIVLRRKLEAARVNAEVVGDLVLSPSTQLDPDRFRDLIEMHDVHRVIVAPVTTDALDTLDLIRLAKSVGVRVSVLPRLFEVVGSSVEFDHLDGLTMLGVRRFGLTRSSRVLKRGFDLAGASVGLLAVAPVLLFIAIAVRLESRGPVFFRQTRVGMGGRRFHMIKFRSMVPDAESRKASLRHLNETQGLFKIADDPRITRVGRFLRKTSLDELPQLLNVWRGEMSLVGPRPLVVDEDAKIGGLDRSRLHLTPGMTGHWQILGSARIPMDEMVGIDYLYVANWSLWTDVKILLRTVPYVVGRGSM